MSVPREFIAKRKEHTTEESTFLHGGAWWKIWDEARGGWEPPNDPAARWLSLGGLFIGRLAAVSSVPGGVSLFVVDPQGAVQSTYYDTRVAGPRWVDWLRLSDPGKVAPKTRVAAVSSVPGGASVFIVDAAGAIESTYLDPRTAG